MKVIAINSISGGGKTTTTNELLKRIPNSKALYFDDRDYASVSGIFDLCKWELEDGADHSLWNLQALVDDITSLMNENLEYIFLDYPFGYLQKQISGFVSLSVYVDTPLDVAVARRILRDFKNRSVDEIVSDMDWYIKRGRESYVNSVKTSKEYADFIVDGTLTLDDICNLIIEKIQSC
jgi:Uridine kinase